jgi:hypothetical protein
MKSDIDLHSSQLIAINMDTYDMEISTAIYNDVVACTLRTVNYTTASLDKLMIIKIDKGFDQTDYYGGQGRRKIFKALPMFRKLDADYIYSNGDNTFDAKFVYNPISVLDKLRIEVTLDGDNAVDITPSNPLYLELELYFVKK